MYPVSGPTSRRDDADTATRLRVGDGHRAVVVPETAISLDERGDVEAVARDVRFKGATWRVELLVERAGAEPIVLIWHTTRPPAAGERVCVALDRAAVKALS